VLANSAQLTAHALVMLWLAHRRLGGIAGQGLGTTALKLAVAGAALAAFLFLAPALPAGEGLPDKLWRVVLPATVAATIYLVGLRVLRVRAAGQIRALVAGRLARKSK